MGSEGAAFDLDLFAAAIRADSADMPALVEGLAVKLEELLPGAVRVQRGRAGLMGPKLVRKIALELADQRLELEWRRNNTVGAHRARISGGIVLKSEELDVDAWLRIVGEVVAAEADRNERTRQALERLLTG